MIIKSIGDRRWSQPSQDATEDEVRDFLYGLIRLIKPWTAIEIGCHHGQASVAIGRALLKNSYGHLDTCDINPEMVDLTATATRGLPVSVFCCSGIELADEPVINGFEVDFAFIDSGKDRFEEAKAIRWSPNAYCVLHDSNQTEYPGLEAFRTRGWKDITFATPVGLALFQIP